MLVVWHHDDGNDRDTLHYTTHKGWFSITSESETESQSESEARRNRSRKNRNCSMFFWLRFVSVAYDKWKLKYWKRNQKQAANHSTLFLTSWRGFSFISRLPIPLLTIWFTLRFFVPTVLWFRLRFRRKWKSALIVRPQERWWNVTKIFCQPCSWLCVVCDLCSSGGDVMVGLIVVMYSLFYH